MPQNLRRYEVRRAGDLLQIAVFCHCSKAKVDKTDLVIFGDHDIVRFDVSVYYILGMAMVNCLKKLLHVGGRLNLVEVVLLSNLFEKRLALSQLHDQIDVSLVIVRLKVLYDVRVVHLIQQHYFGIYLRQVVLELFFVQDFDGDFEICFEQIMCGEDFTEAACPDHFGRGV